MHSSLRVQALRHIVLVGSGVDHPWVRGGGGAGCADALGGGDAERGDGVRQFVERRAEGHGDDAVRRSPADGLALHPARAEGPGRARHERGAKATRPGAGRYDRADWVEEGPGDHAPRRSARDLEPEKIKLEGHKGEITRSSADQAITASWCTACRLPKGTWAWSAEGHHVSVNITVVDGQISSTPFFLGSDPAEVKDGAQRGLRILAAEEDQARELLLSFDDAQRKVAIVSPTTHGDIVTFSQQEGGSAPTRRRSGYGRSDCR